MSRRYGGGDRLYHFKDQCPVAGRANSSPGKTPGVQTTGEAIPIPIRAESWDWLLELADMGLERYQSLPSGTEKRKVEFGRNLLHFLNLRMDEHAQREIRAYATIIGEEIVAKWVPIVWEAFLDYQRHAISLSRIEVEIIGALTSQDPKHACNLAAKCGLLSRRKDGSLARNRERVELEAKLRMFGLTPPWT